MTRAEEYVEDLEMIIDDNPEWYGNRKSYDRVVALFQRALDIPMPLTDKKPKKEGYYWYEDKHGRVMRVKIDYNLYVHVCEGYSKGYTYPQGCNLGHVNNLTGRFSHRILPPEGE